MTDKPYCGEWPPLPALGLLPDAGWRWLGYTKSHIPSGKGLHLNDGVGIVDGHMCDIAAVADGVAGRSGSRPYQPMRFDVHHHDVACLDDVAEVLISRQARVAIRRDGALLFIPSSSRIAGHPRVNEPNDTPRPQVHIETFKGTFPYRSKLQFLVYQLPSLPPLETDDEPTKGWVRWCEPSADNEVLADPVSWEDGSKPSAPVHDGDRVVQAAVGSVVAALKANGELWVAHDIVVSNDHRKRPWVHVRP